MDEIQENNNKERFKNDYKEIVEDFHIDNHESSVMINDESTNQPVVSRLQQQIDQLQQEKESLEIDNVCLKQQNHELKSRIDDVATHFPKTSILLGKKPEQVKKKKGLKINLKRNKK